MQRRLSTPYFGMHRYDELPDEPVEFNLPYGEWIRLFRENGFRIETLVEVRPPEARRLDVPDRGGDRVGALVADGGDLAMPEDGLTEHAAANRESWAKEAASYVAGAERNWATDEITWGILERARESSSLILPNVDGKDVVELGCGTAYVSAWLARRGARPVGVDLTAEQLETARRMQAKHGLDFPLVHAERRGCAAAGCVVRRGGLRVRREHLVRSRPLGRRGSAAAPAGRRARLPRQRDAADAHVAGRRSGRAGGSGAPSSVLRHAPVRAGSRTTPSTSTSGYGDWIRVLTSHGFEVERLVELQATRARGSGRYDVFTPEWAERGPPRRCGRPARSRERPARAAAAPRLDLAAAARDPRAARAAVRGRATALRGARSARRRSRSSSCARTRRARRDRSRTRPATVPCSAWTRRSSAAAASTARRRGRKRRPQMLAALGGPHARGGLGPLPVTPALGGARTPRRRASPSVS